MFLKKVTVLSLQIVCVTSWAWSNLRTSGETQLGPLIPQPIKGSGFPIGLGRLLDQALNFECLCGGCVRCSDLETLLKLSVGNGDKL